MSDGNMEEGSLRCDANVSVRPAGDDRARHQGRAQEHELASGSWSAASTPRSRARPRSLESGGRVMQETLHFDPDTRRDPLPAQQGGGARLPLLPGARPGAAGARPGWVEEMRAGLPELPVDRRRRWMRDLGLTYEDAEVLSRDAGAGGLLRGGRRRRADPKAAANWVRGELRAQLRELRRGALGEPRHPRAPGRADRRWWRTARSRARGQGGARRGRSRAAPSRRRSWSERGLGQISDEGELRGAGRAAAGGEPRPGPAAPRAARTRSSGFFVGQAMKASGGRADPAAARDLVREVILGGGG